MAHAANIEIPAKFAFRPFCAHWNFCCVEILGWWEIPTSQHPNLPPVARLALTTELLHIEKVKVRVSIPSEDDQSPGAMLLGIQNSSEYEITIKRSDIPTDVLPPHENRKDTPDISGREFYVLVCSMPEFGQFFSSPKPGDFEKDAWKLRDEFFALENDLFSVHQFLNRWGLWNYGDGYEWGMSWGERPPFILAYPHIILEQRDKYLNALTGNPRAWLSSEITLNFTRLEQPPFFLVLRSYCEDAIKATITIDHLAKAKFGICKLPDCRRLFEKTTKQKRLYCSPEHAHLANVRKLRADKKKAELKRRKNAKS